MKSDCAAGHGADLSAEEYNSLVRDAMRWRASHSKDGSTSRKEPSEVALKLLAVRLRQVASGALPFDDYAKARLQEVADLLVLRSETGASSVPSATAHTTDEEALLLHAVLDQARETLLVSIKGTPEHLQQSLGKLNLACLAHWNWRGEKIRKADSRSAK